jgi:hypothetical protein
MGVENEVPEKAQERCCGLPWLRDEVTVKGLWMRMSR